MSDTEIRELSGVRTVASHLVKLTERETDLVIETDTPHGRQALLTPPLARRLARQLYRMARMIEARAGGGASFSAPDAALLTALRQSQEREAMLREALVKDEAYREQSVTFQFRLYDMKQAIEAALAATKGGEGREERIGYQQGYDAALNAACSAIEKLGGRDKTGSEG